MSVGERDPHTGHMTTGHQWNGIKELNTKVPRPVYFFLSLAFAVALLMWVLLPTWPTGASYTPGLLELDDRAELKQELQAIKKSKQAFDQKVLASTFKDVRNNDALFMKVSSSGRILFLDNCAACHGADGKGGKGFPNLVDDSWLWGGDEEAIMETLRVGINADHEDTRYAQMTAFGRDETLDRAAIKQVSDYILSLNVVPPHEKLDPASVEAGSEIFDDNCTGCHGDEATGLTDVGAPNLTDKSWIYGSDRQTLFNTLWNGRQGHMPSWEGRLSKADRKILTLYVLSIASSLRKCGGECS